VTAPDDSGAAEAAALRIPNAPPLSGDALTRADEAAWIELGALRAENRQLREDNSTMQARYVESGDSVRRTLQDALAAQSNTVTTLWERLVAMTARYDAEHAYVKWLERQIEDPAARDSLDRHPPGTG
jgi:hypothetical protein